MSIQDLPPSNETLDTVALRQALAGLIDPQAQKAEWFDETARGLAVNFCASLPRIFGESLDRLTMWDKIAAAIQSAYAKTVSGDIDLFVNHICESLKIDHAKTLACDDFTDAVMSLQELHGQQRQDWMTYLATHLTPILVRAKRAYKAGIEARKEAAQ